MDEHIGDECTQPASNNPNSFIPSLTSVYVNFWNSIRVSLNGYAEQASNNDIEVHSVNGKLKVKSKTPFWMTGLPNRRDRRNPGIIDVAITFEQEVIVKNDHKGDRYLEAVVSYVRMLYLENYDEVKRKIGKNGNYKSQVLSGFHFDLVDQENKNMDWYDHPIYHANFDLKCIDLGSLRKEGYVLPVNQRRIDYPRIPTAPINLAGAIFLLLRDHLPDSVEKGWPEMIQKSVSKLPLYPSGILSKYLRDDRYLDCLSWYNTDGRRNSIQSHNS